MRRIERTFGVSRRTLSAWLKEQENDLPSLEETLQPVECKKIPVLEVDELWSFVFRRKDKVWVWIAMNRETQEIVASACGDRTENTCRILWDRLPIVGWISLQKSSLPEDERSLLGFSCNMHYDLSLYPKWRESQTLFSIFIPTYNRARLLNRALESCSRQTFRDFEVMVVDDGSTDDTVSVLKKWVNKAGFRLRWLKQENGGKPRAYNVALEQVRGYFLVVLDSDDCLVENALSCFKHHWEEIPNDRKPFFSGVEGLMRDLHGGTISGGPLSKPIIDSNYLEMEYRYKHSGDRRHAIRVAIARAYPFPVINGEKEMCESIIFARMAHRYRFRYFNEVVQEYEQLPDGLTARSAWRRWSSPLSFRLAFMELINVHHIYLNPLQLYRCALMYVRYSISGRVGIEHQLRDIDRPFLWASALPAGLFKGWKDRIRRDFFRKR